MARIVGGIAVVAILAFGVWAVRLYGSIHAFESERVTDDVHVVRVERLGGNVGVLATGTGAIVVDTMTFRSQGKRVLELAEELGRGPVQAIVNTHYHQDHTHGNPAFAPGTRVIATQHTLDLLQALDGGYWQGPAAGTLPSETFDDRHELRIGGKTVRCHHLGRGHTGGDLVVHFVEDRVVHTGDLFVNRRYPNIDLEAGGSLREWDATLERLLALDFEQAIPGHGPVASRGDVLAFQGFLRELWTQVSAAAEAGLSLEDTLARVELRADAGYEVTSLPFVFRLDRDFVVRRAWEEATGAVEPLEFPDPADPTEVPRS